MYVVIVGEFGLGFDIIGPFQEAFEAEEYAKGEENTWWIVRLHSPEETEETE